MNANLLVSIAAAAALAGCCSFNKEGSGSPSDAFACEKSVIGNWGLKLPYDNMNAGHMIVSQGEHGKAQALVLWR